MAWYIAIVFLVAVCAFNLGVVVMAIIFAGRSYDD
jgi:hypothetical protein